MTTVDHYLQVKQSRAFSFGFSAVSVTSGLCLCVPRDDARTCMCACLRVCRCYDHIAVARVFSRCFYWKYCVCVCVCVCARACAWARVYPLPSTTVASNSAARHIKEILTQSGHTRNHSSGTDRLVQPCPPWKPINGNGRQAAPPASAGLAMELYT